MSEWTHAAPRAIARLAGVLCAIVFVASIVALGSAYLGAAPEDAPDRPIRASELPARLMQNSRSNELPHGRWRFAAIGDPEDNRPVLRACLKRARELDCAFVVLTGDLVKRESALSFRMLLVDLQEFGFRERVATVRGNHDAQWLYRAFFGDEDWTIDIGGIRFVGLDNGTDSIEGEHLEFAKRALARPRPGPVVLFIHKPVFPYRLPREQVDRPSAAEEYAANDREDDWKLRHLCVAEGVDYVIASHLHAYERGTFDGVTQVISGAGGGNPQGTFDGWNLLIGEVDGGKLDVRRENVPDPAFSFVARAQRIGLSLDQDLTQKPHRTVLWFGIPLVGMTLLFVRRRPCPAPSP